MCCNARSQSPPVFAADINPHPHILTHTQGAGAGHKVPVLFPHSEYSYNSDAFLSTPSGSFFGSFQFESLKDCNNITGNITLPLPEQYTCHFPAYLISLSPAKGQTCTVSASEAAWRMWGTHSCQQVHSEWGVCTNGADPNHDTMVTNCPATCGWARGECSKNWKPTTLKLGDQFSTPVHRVALVHREQLGGRVVEVGAQRVGKV